MSNVTFVMADTLYGSIDLAGTAGRLHFFKCALRTDGTTGVLSLLALRSHIG